MTSQQIFVAALRTQKRWADAWSLVSVILVVALLGATALLADYSKVDTGTQIGMLIIMASIIIVVCIWQAGAFPPASIQKLIIEGRDAAQAHNRAQ